MRINLNDIKNTPNEIKKISKDVRDASELIQTRKAFFTDHPMNVKFTHNAFALEELHKNTEYKKIIRKQIQMFCLLLLFIGPLNIFLIKNDGLNHKEIFFAFIILFDFFMIIALKNLFTKPIVNFGIIKSSEVLKNHTGNYITQDDLIYSITTDNGEDIFPCGPVSEKVIKEGFSTGESVLVYKTGMKNIFFLKNIHIILIKRKGE